MENNNTTQNQSRVARHNESLEDAANNFADSKYDKSLSEPKDGWNLKESTLWEKSKKNFEAGANWQKEKDKAIIEKQRQMLEALLSLAETWCNGVQYPTILAAKQLLNQPK